MADNTQAIADLNCAIAAGVTSVTIDGTVVNYRNLAEMRSTLRQLHVDNTEGAGPKRPKRPVLATIKTGGF